MLPFFGLFYFSTYYYSPKKLSKILAYTFFVTFLLILIADLLFEKSNFIGIFKNLDIFFYYICFCKLTNISLIRLIFPYIKYSVIILG